jgi:hypothetical protein
MQLNRNIVIVTVETAVSSQDECLLIAYLYSMTKFYTKKGVK